MATTDSEAASSLAVEMGEWFFQVDQETVKAGKISVTAANVGDIDHELIVVKTDLPADEMPVTPDGLDAEKAGELVIGKPHGHDEGSGSEGAGHDNSDGHHEEVSDAGAEATAKLAVAEKDEPDHASESEQEGHIGPGETREYEVTLEPGSYVLLCSLPGHYAAGQYVSLTVVE